MKHSCNLQYDKTGKDRYFVMDYFLFLMTTSNSSTSIKDSEE